MSSAAQSSSWPLQRKALSNVYIDNMSDKTGQRGDDKYKPNLRWITLKFTCIQPISSTESLPLLQQQKQLNNKWLLWPAGARQ